MDYHNLSQTDYFSFSFNFFEKKATQLTEKNTRINKIENNLRQLNLKSIFINNFFFLNLNLFYSWVDREHMSGYSGINTFI